MYSFAVRTAKEYIAAGELMQIQVGQRLTKPYRDNPLSLYGALRSLNPPPYLSYYNFGEFHLVGASPDILVRREKRGDAQMVTLRP
ncbi:anthranilate synthase, partial [Burkholderia pseudomallei]